MTTEKHALDCRAAMLQLYDFLDGELSEERIKQIREHLAQCGPCYAHASFEKDLLAVIANGWKDIAASAPLRERIRAGLKQAGFRR